MDDKLYAAWVTGAAGLTGTLIGAMVSLVTTHAVTKREQKKERLTRAYSLTVQELLPKVYQPILEIYRNGERRFQRDLALDWPHQDLLKILREQRFLILLAPPAVGEVLFQLEKHINRQDLGDAQSLRIREDLQKLEKAIAETYASLRLEGSNGA